MTSFSNIWIRGEACENKNNAENWPSQPVCKVHHLTAIPTVITLLIMLGFQQRLASFVFPKNSQKGMLGVIWSNEEIKDGFRISKSTWVCEKYFLPEKIYGPGVTRKRLIQGARQVLHSWNNFTFIEKHRKEPLRRSPRKIVKVADCTEQHWCATGLIWNWWQYSTWWFSSRF